MGKINLVLVLLLGSCWVALAQEPASQPVVLDASDKQGLADHMNTEVVVEGVVASAEWSRSGAVMNIEFRNAEESRLLAVIFQRQRQKFDEAYAGDVGKALTGARVRMRGKLVEYGGRSEAWKGRPQIVLNLPNQITIVEPAPSTQPAQ